MHIENQYARMKMIKFSVCIEALYGKVPTYIERIEKSAAVGMKAFEFGVLAIRI